jgi:hypothetical protein
MAMVRALQIETLTDYTSTVFFYKVSYLPAGRQAKIPHKPSLSIAGKSRILDKDSCIL